MTLIKYTDVARNTRGDSLPDYRLQVVTSAGAGVDIYSDGAGTRFRDGSGNVVNYATANPSGKVEFYWTPATGQILQVLDTSGTLVDTDADFADKYVKANLAGELPQDQVTDLPADLAAKADAAATATALAAKAETADLASTDSAKGAALVKRETGGTLAQALQGALNAAEFGMAPANTASENSAALKAAIAAASASDRIVIPQGSYAMSVTGGLSDAATINKALTLEINGTLTANGFAIQANPYYMFRVTADDVQFTGTGTIAGNGTIDDANSGDITTHPGLIYVEGDRFVFGRNLNVVDFPKVGIVLANCEDANIGGRWTGGPTTYSDTGYLGIIATGGEGHVFEGIQAVRDAGGGRIVNLIFASGSLGNCDNCTVRNCYADVWEKLFYGYGNDHTVHDNEGIGFQTDWIRLIGLRNKARNNTVSGAASIVSAYDGVNIEITGNTGTGLTQAAVVVGRLSGSYTGGFSGLKVNGNKGSGTGAGVIDGIQIVVDGATSQDIEVKLNTLDNFAASSGRSMIRVNAVSPYSINDADISGNKLFSTSYTGISLDRVVDSTIQGNTGRAIGTYFLAETGAAQNLWLNNSATSVGNIGINGLASTSEGRGNRYTTATLSGLTTLSAAITTTVTHGGVAPNARVFLQTANDAAGVMIVSKGWPTTAISTDDFTIAMANGTAAGGTEQFLYRIEQ